MNISLPPELEELIARKIASGGYASAGEVVSEGLRLLRERDELRLLRLEELRREVLIGYEQMRRGESKAYESADDLVNDIVARGRERVAAERQAQKR